LHKPIGETILQSSIATASAAGNAGITPEFLSEKTSHYIVDRFLPAVWMAGPARFLLRRATSGITLFLDNPNQRFAAASKLDKQPIFLQYF